VDVTSVVGQGSTFRIMLPLTLAILPVLMVRLGTQPFAVPLSMVREILPIRSEDVQRVSGKATMIVREEVLPIRTLASLIGWPVTGVPSFGVLMQCGESNFILAIDSFIGQADVVIKPLHDIKPKGIAGATLTGDGAIVLVLDMEALLSGGSQQDTKAALFA
jgi:two-component system chemotaxis sensor kinase CheA